MPAACCNLLCAAALSFKRIVPQPQLGVDRPVLVPRYPPPLLVLYIVYCIFYAPGAVQEDFASASDNSTAAVSFIHLAILIHSLHVSLINYILHHITYNMNM